jgi:hypothetical protein
MMDQKDKQLSSHGQRSTIGDCFLFKDSIPDFGLVLIDAKTVPEGKWYLLFPVRLDKDRKGIDQFSHGTAYLTNKLEDENGQKPGFGFMGFQFNEEEYSNCMQRLLNYEGFLKIKPGFRNAAGATAATEYWHFQVVLDQWDQIFGMSTATTIPKKIRMLEVLEDK